jgi:hypothetical protein
VSDDYQDAAGIPVSRPAEITYLLRCLSDDCEWRAFEVEEYIKQLEADRDTLAAEVRAWRYDVPCDTTDLVASDGTPTRLGEWIKLTDASGALQRAKEAE